MPHDQVDDAMHPEHIARRIARVGHAVGKQVQAAIRQRRLLYREVHARHDAERDLRELQRHAAHRDDRTARRERRIGLRGDAVWLRLPL